MSLHDEGGRRRRFGAVASIVFLDAMGLGIIQPILPFLALHYGAGPAMVTQLIALYALAAFLVTPQLGRLSDRIGRPIVLLITVFGSAASYVGMLLSSSLGGLFVFRAVGGAASSNESIAQALVTDGLESGKHASALATLGAVKNVGTISGPIIGGALAALVAPAILFHATLGVALAVALCTLLATFVVFRGAFGRRAPEAAKAARTEPSTSRGLPARDVLGALAGTALVAVPTALLFSITALYVDAVFGWDARHTGLLLGLCTAGVVLSRLFLVPRISARVKPNTGLAIMASVTSVGLTGAAVSTHGVAFFVFYILFAVGCSGALVFTATTVSIRAPAAARGQYLGWNQATYALATVVSALLYGAVFEKLGPQAPFYIGIATIALVAAAAWGVAVVGRTAARTVP